MNTNELRHINMLSNFRKPNFVPHHLQNTRCDLIANMVNPAILAVSFGVVLGGAIFALFYLGSRNHQNNEHRYERRPRADPIELIQSQLEA